MKYFYILCISVLFCSNVLAQINQVTVRGTITDIKGEPLIGANVIIKNQPGIGVVADFNGNYTIKTEVNSVLVYSFIGYEKKEVLVNKKSLINVQLEEKTSDIGEVAVIGHGVQKKESVVGAITSVDVAHLSPTTAQLSNSLAGNVAGIIAVQRSGEPGENNSEFWIRGISTFGANAHALVLVDGVERNFNEINVEDIAHFSVLKDASATAIYGNRGANGVIIITTKRGKEGKLNINFKAHYGVKTPSKMPEFVDGPTYARLANEASLSRGGEPIYSESEMDIIGYGLDPDLYPNIDWRDVMCKDIMSNYRATLSLSGGGSIVRYYVSGAYYNEGGMYKFGDLNDYDTNVNYKRYNFRSNVDMSVTKSTTLSFSLGAWIADQNKPGDGNSDGIWNSFASITPITVPMEYSNGLLPSYGSTSNQMSPFVLLTKTGYLTKWDNKLETNLTLKQDLNFITKGLKFTGRFSYDTYNKNSIRRATFPDIYRAELQRDKNGNLVLRRVGTASPLSQESSSSGNKKYYTEASLNYNRVFDSVHRVGGLIFFYQQDYSVNDPGGDIFNSIPKRNQALSGRATYAYKDKYMCEFNFGYTGSENFEKGKRFGFFPAFAAGYLISKEEFMRSIPWIKSLKARYSYGKVGNDKIRGKRFPYMTTVKGSGGYRFGDKGEFGVGGITSDKIGVQNLTWEVSTKQNLGIDLNVNDRFKITADIFRDKREKIFMERSHINGAVGIKGNQKPWANVGVMLSKGIDANFSYTKNFDDLRLTFRGNFTYANNEILDYDEAANSLYYQQTEGYRYRQTRGLIALGLFKDEAEIANSPKQTFGEVRPGDLRYKDVNGDGVINADDVVPIGHSSVPEVVYGFGLNANYKKIDFGFLFTGTSNSDFFLSGNAANPFINAELGNVMTNVANQSNRWTSREISGTKDTENPNALYPRLSYGANKNNNRNSTHWLRNNRYLRLKEVKLGYTLPSKITNKFKMGSARFYMIATNLLVFSPFKWWDPELASGNGARYPLSKQVTIGLNVNF